MNIWRRIYLLIEPWMIGYFRSNGMDVLPAGKYKNDITELENQIQQERARLFAARMEAETAKSRTKPGLGE